MIPKEVIICDWHYEKRDSYPSLQMFLDKGSAIFRLAGSMSERASLIDTPSMATAGRRSARERVVRIHPRRGQHATCDPHGCDAGQLDALTVIACVGLVLVSERCTADFSAALVTDALTIGIFSCPNA